VAPCAVLALVLNSKFSVMEVRSSIIGGLFRICAHGCCPRFCGHSRFTLRR
jgi:hypothetical protein